MRHRLMSACRRPLWACQARAGISTLWSCPSSISSANHSIAHPPRCPEGWFCRGCHGIWHVRSMQVSLSWQLPEEVPVDPVGSWSCCTPSHWSRAPSRRYNGEVFSCTWFQKPGFFFQSQQPGSMFHSCRGKWRRQETCGAWTCLRCWWCWTIRSCLVWPLLPSLKQWCGLLLSRFHLCTGLLPGTWRWSPPLSSGCSCPYLHWRCLCWWSWSCSFLCLTSIPHVVGPSKSLPKPNPLTCSSGNLNESTAKRGQETAFLAVEGRYTLHDYQSSNITPKRRK